MKFPKAENHIAQSTLEALINHYVCVETERLDILHQKPSDVMNVDIYGEGMYQEIIQMETSNAYYEKFVETGQIPQKIDYPLQQYTIELDNAITEWQSKHPNTLITNKEDSLKYAEDFRKSDLFKQVRDNLVNNEYATDEQKQRYIAYLDTPNIERTSFVQAFENRLLVEQQLRILNKKAMDENISPKEVEAFGFGIAATFDRNSNFSIAQNHGICHAPLDVKASKELNDTQNKDYNLLLNRGKDLANAILLGEQIDPDSLAGKAIKAVNKNEPYRNIPAVDADKPASYDPKILQLNDETYKIVTDNKIKSAIINTDIHKNELIIEKKQHELGSINGFHPFKKLSIKMSINKLYKEQKNLKNDLIQAELNSDVNFMLQKQKLHEWCTQKNIPERNIDDIFGRSMRKNISKFQNSDQDEFKYMLNSLLTSEFEAKVKVGAINDSSTEKNKWAKNVNQKLLKFGPIPEDIQLRNEDFGNRTAFQPLTFQQIEENIVAPVIPDNKPNVPRAQTNSQGGGTFGEYFDDMFSADQQTQNIPPIIQENIMNHKIATTKVDNDIAQESNSIKPNN